MGLPGSIVAFPRFERRRHAGCRLRIERIEADQPVGVEIITRAGRMVEARMVGRQRAQQCARVTAFAAEGLRLRDGWEAWNATMPPVPDDATVSLGYSVKDMPQR